MTVIEYIQKLRIEKSIHLLYSGDLAIRDISYEVGYNDVSFFYNLFKKHTGKTPGELRQTSWHPARFVYRRYGTEITVFLEIVL